MAARIVWCMLILGILAVFHLPVTKEQPDCIRNGSCYTCYNRKVDKYNCLVYFYCIPSTISKCIEYGPCENQPSENISQTNEGNWPWQVSIQTSYYGHICGGVLLDTDWVLTVAHCVDKLNVKDLTVVLGEIDLKQISGKEQFQRIKHIFLHPGFRAMSHLRTYDVALIQLENDTHYNEYVSPINLPSYNDVYATNSCTITGWGEKGKGDNSLLRFEKVTVLDLGECEILLLKYYLRHRHHTCNIYGACAVTNKVCIVESGGPLSCIRSSDGQYVVVGVASLGRACPEHGVPTIHTNIQTFVPWINKIMERNKKKP